MIPGTAASLLLNGTITSHTNLTGDSEPQLHPTVQTFFDTLPPALREPFIGNCAETALISHALFGLDRQRGDGRTVTLDEAAPHFASATLVARKIRPHGDPEHGTEADVCRSCSTLLDRLGIALIHDQA
ncbi:hypothetical protein AMK27_37375 [Streptomyces sp. CB02009]|nr:hypothetical protein AMK27_37375 [Streptomyces sp. CB02009]